jgi:Potential Queuosine, Q, salvage protein family
MRVGCDEAVPVSLLLVALCAQPSQMTDVLAQLREAAGAVAERAQHVRVNQAVIADYAAALPLTDAADAASGDAAFWLTLDAINFGSGWFPTLRKRPGHSGYSTVAAGIEARFERRGPWSPAELEQISPREVAETLGQDPSHELMALFAASLNDLGRHVGAAGGFSLVIPDSASALVEELAGWECFADASTYDELTLPFLKRAQIAAADLQRARAASFEDLERLTIFADNLVPHVLRLDGILTFDPELTERIDREQLIEHGSPEEVEIRACALHAVELIVAERPGATAAEIDQLLWRRGQEPFYKASPRHRSRTTAY